MHKPDAFNAFSLTDTFKACLNIATALSMLP